MPSEGMVHALKIIHTLLKTSGLLVDIHPMGEPPEIVVRSGRKTAHAGWLQESDDFVEYPQATLAIEQSIAEGWYAVEKQRDFIFITQAETVDMLRTFLEAQWKDAIVPSEAMQLAQEYIASMGEGSKVQVLERVGIVGLRRS